MSPSRRPRPRRPPAPLPIRSRRRRARPSRRGRLLGLLLVLVVLAAAGIAGATAVMTFAPAATCRRCTRRRSARTPSSTPPTARCSGRSPPSETARSSRSRGWPVAPLATVAIEDRRFYSHGGIDAEGIARALWRDVSAGRVVEGGSTITQQLVRTLYISNERTVERKVTEACLAVKLDRKWSREDPRDVPELRLLRKPRVRRRGRVPHVLLALRPCADATARPRSSPDSRRHLGVRPVRRPCPRRSRAATRSSTRCCSRG